MMLWCGLGIPIICLIHYVSYNWGPPHEHGTSHPHANTNNDTTCHDAPYQHASHWHWHWHMHIPPELSMWWSLCFHVTTWHDIRYATDTKFQTTNAVWEQTFTFESVELTEQQFANEKLVIISNEMCHCHWSYQHVTWINSLIPSRTELHLHAIRSDSDRIGSFHPTRVVPLHPWIQGCAITIILSQLHPTSTRDV